MSKFYRLRSNWTDSLSIQWPSEEVTWPLPKLVGAAVHQFINSGSNGTLIIPLWRSAAWWPLIYPRERRGGPGWVFIKDVKALGRARMFGHLSHDLLWEQSLAHNLLELSVAKRTHSS